MKGLLCGGRTAVIGGLCALAAALVAVSAAQATTPPLNLAYGGVAYGSLVKVGTAVTSGQTFPASLSICYAKAGSSSSNSGASTNVPNILSTGTVSNSMAASATSTSGTTRATSTVQNVKLLGGLVKATTVQAVSTVTYTASTKAFTFGNGSSLAGLTIAGQSVSVGTLMNTTFTLPGVGYVVLNETHRTVGTGYAAQTVTMIHLVVTVSGNVYGLSPGTNVYVGTASALLHSPIAGGPVTGGAYGTHANVGSLVISGYSALVSIPCLGGSRSNTIASVNLPNIGSTGTVTTSASSTVGATSSTGHTTSTVQTVNLLGGLIKATVLKADVSGSFNGLTHHFIDNSTATSLVVNGHAVTATAGTVINIPGLGTLYVHRVIQTTRSYVVRMLELVVTASNPYGLAIGTDVQVAAAGVAFRD